MLQITAFIEAHLGEADLAPAQIAVAHHISCANCTSSSTPAAPPWPARSAAPPRALRPRPARSALRDAVGGRDEDPVGLSGPGPLQRAVQGDLRSGPARLPRRLRTGRAGPRRPRAGTAGSGPAAAGPLFPPDRPWCGPPGALTSRCDKSRSCTPAVKRRALACKTGGGRQASMGGVAPSPRLQGKAAIITGGEGSIGMATARALVAEGARVCLIGLVADQVQAGASSLGGAARWAVADVTDSIPGYRHGGRGGGAVRPPGRGGEQRGDQRGDRAGGRLPGRGLRPGARRARARVVPGVQALASVPGTGRQHRDHLQRGRPHLGRGHLRLPRPSTRWSG